MQNKDSQVITWTAKFINHAMNKRIRSIVTLMIYNSQWKTGCSTGSCTKQKFLTCHIYFVCISSRTHFHFMYFHMCKRVCMCVGMHAWASAHMYIWKHTWVCMITHVFKWMLQHVMMLPLIAIHVILFCFLSTFVQFYIITLYMCSVFHNHVNVYFYPCT